MCFLPCRVPTLNLPSGMPRFHATTTRIHRPPSNPDPHPIPLYLGYDWVGWRNDSLGWAGKPVEMVFEFDTVRNFSAMVLHTNNMYSKDVQVSAFFFFFLPFSLAHNSFPFYFCVQQTYIPSSHCTHWNPASVPHYRNLQ